MNVYVRLPDRPLPKGLVAYFEDHGELLEKINSKQKCIVPIEVMKEMRQHVIVNLLGRAPDPPSTQEELPQEAENPIEPEATDASQPEDIFEVSSEDSESLLDALMEIEGIGKATAEKVVAICNADIDILKMKLKNDDLDIREDYLKKIKDKFLGVDFA